MEITDEFIEKLFDNKLFLSKLNELTNKNDTASEEDEYCCSDEEDESGDESEEESNEDTSDFDDYTEDEVVKIRHTIQLFKQQRLNNPHSQLLQPFLDEEIKVYEDRIGFELPKSFRNYILKISREFYYSKLGFKVDFDLDKLTEDSTSIYLNGLGCSQNNSLVLVGKRRGKIMNEFHYDSCHQRPCVAWNDFKSFVMYYMNG